MIKIKPLYGLAFLAVLIIGQALLTSCVSHPHVKQIGGGSVKPNPSNFQTDKISAVVWFEYSAEARALYYQAFNIARDRLDKAIADSHPTDQLAVIMDIDETLLDNSPYQAFQIESNQPYTLKSLNEWNELARSRPLPGAVDFLNHAARCNVDIFYLSNRPKKEFEVTMANLQVEGFPIVDQRHLILQSDKEGKEPHRADITNSYNVVLLMGDNLDDFSSNFDRYTVNDRFNITDASKDEFGRRFILLPNPMYGDWEKAIYTNMSISEESKASIRRQLIQKLCPTN